MRILVHVCCAPCYAKAFTGLRQSLGENTDITAHWYNPNIHPLIEYRRRLKTFQVYSERLKLPHIIDDYYGLTEFCQAVNNSQNIPERCRICYRMRLEKTAQHAKDNGFDAFTSTLCTSLHQSHELIRAAGEAAAQKYGSTFLYHDLRESQPDEKSLNGIYRQQYCGCIFSEYDRYKDTSLHLYKGQ